MNSDDLQIIRPVSGGSDARYACGELFSVLSILILHRNDPHDVAAGIPLAGSSRLQCRCVCHVFKPRMVKFGPGIIGLSGENAPE